MTPADTLRAAADLIADPEVITPEQRWLDVIPNSTADALAAWLRAEADCIEQTGDVGEHMPKVLEGIEASLAGAKPRRYGMRVSISTSEQAVAFARAILGEAS